ncbi:MAG TPA: rhodanese-like domain-containing protein, partial [Bacteroidales bacterium]|nr:rhodanese-like domain-containing protein [Bacteroidales bacterium]
MKTIQGKVLDKLLSQKNILLIDTRPVDVYNGWDGENSPGGHIPGAKSLPSKWTSYIDWIEIVRKKGLLEYQTLVLYGNKPSEVNNAAKMFEKAGHTDVRIYGDFILDHQDSPRFKLEKLSRFHHLVPPWWVKTLIEGKPVDHMYGKDAVICHVHYQNPEDYKKGHIPGAIPLDTNDLESTKTWNRRSSEELQQALTEHGISKSSTVILYGRFSYPDNQSDFPGSNAGQLGAMRAAAIMLYAG